MRDGMWNTPTATISDVANPSSADQCALMRSTARLPNSTITGSAAMIVDSHQRPVGSYPCCHALALGGRRRITTDAMTATTMVRMKPKPELGVFAGGAVPGFFGTAWIGGSV